MAARRKPKKRSPAPKCPKRGRGRPSGYRSEFCARVVALGRDGKSRAQIAADLDVSRQTLATWEKAHSEFLDAMRRAHDLALAWFEDQGQRGMWAGKQFNAAAYGLQMRNRFSTEYGRPDTTFELNLDEVRSSIERKLARVAAAGAAAGVPSKPHS